MSWIYTDDDLTAMADVKTAFASSDRFNPCKIFPSGHGCGETHGARIQAKIARFGPDAYV